MTEESFRTLRLEASEGVARVTIDHPPVNLLDALLLEDLDRLSHTLATEPGVRVVVFDSADPEFFIAHADVHGLLGRGDPQAKRRERLSRFAEMTERYRTMDKVTIAVLEGRTRGGGSEFVLALDMRFAARETAIFSQPEVALGIPPGGGATQRLPGLTGRSRALEIILGCEDFDAELAERLRMDQPCIADRRAAPVRRPPRTSDRSVPSTCDRPCQGGRGCRPAVAGRRTVG